MASDVLVICWLRQDIKNLGTGLIIQIASLLLATSGGPFLYTAVTALIFQESGIAVVATCQKRVLRCGSAVESRWDNKAHGIQEGPLALLAGKLKSRAALISCYDRGKLSAQMVSVTGTVGVQGWSNTL